MIRMRSALLASVMLVAALAGCQPAGTAGTLTPTLTIVDNGGLAIAMQNGHPVPSFDWQPRPRLDLDGDWRVERQELDQRLTMTARETSLAEIEQEAGERHLAAHDDTGWETLAVPGTTNPPPAGEEARA